MTSSPNAAKLQDDLQAVIRDAEALLKATAHLTGDSIDVVRAEAAATLKQVKSRIGDTQDAVMAGAADAVKATGDYVKKNPWAAVGVAASIGLVVGLLLSRRD